MALWFYGRFVSQLVPLFVLILYGITVLLGVIVHALLHATLWHGTHGIRILLLL